MLTEHLCMSATDLRFVKQDWALGGADAALLVPGFFEHAAEAGDLTRAERVVKFTVRCRSATLCQLQRRVVAEGGTLKEDFMLCEIIAMVEEAGRPPVLLC